LRGIGFQSRMFAVSSAAGSCALLS
jgi:hypothetical protein